MQLGFSHLLSVPGHNLSFGSRALRKNYLCTKNMEFLTSSHGSHSAISHDLSI